MADAPTTQPELAIAIIGPRTLADPAAVSMAARQARDRILIAFPNRSHVIFSALSEGADRMALAPWIGGESPIDLVAVLPDAKSQYVMSSSSEATRLELATLLRRARSIITLHRPAEGTSAGAALRRWLTEAADVIIALWDGRIEDDEDGVGASIFAARELRRPLAWIRLGGQHAEPDALADLVVERFPEKVSVGVAVWPKSN